MRPRPRCAPPGTCSSTATTCAAAIATLVNATLKMRDPLWWGNGTACASDSKKFGSWSSNLMTEYHVRYGGHGVMIYWHVDRKSVCVYSQLRSCNASEVAAMMEGVLRHCTDATIDRQYTDTHGQSLVGFAFSHLLGFKLLPRMKNIARQKLVKADADDQVPSCLTGMVADKSIDWEIIAQQYDQIVKYATALRLGTAVDHPGSVGGSDTWKGEGLWHPRGSTPLSCGNARFGWSLKSVSRPASGPGRSPGSLTSSGSIARRCARGSGRLRSMAGSGRGHRRATPSGSPILSGKCASCGGRTRS